MKNGLFIAGALGVAAFLLPLMVRAQSLSREELLAAFERAPLATRAITNRWQQRILIYFADRYEALSSADRLFRKKFFPVYFMTYELPVILRDVRLRVQFEFIRRYFPFFPTESLMTDYGWRFSIFHHLPISLIQNVYQAEFLLELALNPGFRTLLAESLAQPHGGATRPIGSKWNPFQVFSTYLPSLTSEAALREFRAAAAKILADGFMTLDPFQGKFAVRCERLLAN